MNLRTGLEQEPYAFAAVTCVSVVTVTCAIGYGWMKLHRLRRIGLSEAPVQHRSGLHNRFTSHQIGWRSEAVWDWDDGRSGGKVRKFWKS